MSTNLKIPIALALAIGFASPGPSWSRTIEVPNEVATISAALAAAEAGDIVSLAPGIYTESDLVLRSGISLVGASGDPLDTIIDAEGRGRVLMCEGVDIDGVIGNITMRGGFADGPTAYERSGGAVFFSHSQPLIANCIFRDNQAMGSGGAFRVTDGSPHLVNCQFIDNVANRGGGAVDVSLDSQPVFDYVYFEGNQAAWGGAVSIRASSRPTFNDCMFVENVASSSHGYGGAVYCDYQSAPTVNFSQFRANVARYGGAAAAFQESALLLQNCTMAANIATGRGHALYCNDATPIIRRAIIAFHAGRPVYCEGISQPHASYTDIYGNNGEDWVGRLAGQESQQGNISADPHFCGSGPDFYDFHLRDDSPCLPENNEDEVLIGALVDGCIVSAFHLVSLDVYVLLGGADVNWEVEYPAMHQEYRVEGARVGADVSVWTVPYQEVDTDRFRAQDRSEEVRRGGQVVYTLFTRISGSPWTVLAQQRVTLLGGQPRIKVGEAWPNPFNPSTNLAFSVARPTWIRVAVHDIAGRVVAVLADGDFAAGEHEVAWHGVRDDGRPVPSGAYFALVESEDFRQIRKFTLLK